MMKSAILGLAAVSSLTVMSAPAAAYDPCVRASERAEEADAAVYRWIRNHCNSGGQCIGNPAYFQRLRERALDARAERARACR